MSMRFVAGSAILALGLLTVNLGTGVQEAGASPVAAAVTHCPSGYIGGSVLLKKNDALKVHTKASTSSAVVGQIPGGNSICIKSNAGNADWDYGYGYNGSKKVTGYFSRKYVSQCVFTANC